MKKGTPLGPFQRSGAAVLKPKVWKQPLLVTGALVLAAVLMFGACTLFTSGGDNAAVNAVVVSPVTSTVAKGGTQTFTAAVAGIGNYDRTVTWMVRGGGEGTAINSAGVLTVAAGETAAGLTVTATSTMDTSKSGTAAVTVTGGDDDDPNLARAKQFRDELNAIAPGSVEVDSVYNTFVNVVADLALNTNVSVPAGVGLSITGGKTLTVDAGATLDLTGGGLLLENNATLTVNGTVNAKAAVSITSYGIAILPGAPASATINGIGIIHLKTPGNLLAITAGQKLTLKGTITLDGLTTATEYPGTSTPYPAGIGGDAMNNTTQVVWIGGELDMQGGTIIGNYNTISTSTGAHGGGVEVNKYQGGNGAAMFTMSGGFITGNGSARAGGGVNVCKGGTFIMKGGVVSLNSAGDHGGGVTVHNDGIFTMKGGTIKSNSAQYGGGVEVHTNEDAVTTFTMEGGTIYGSGEGTDANTATYGASLYVDYSGGSSGTAKWGIGSTSISGGDGGTTSGGNIINGGIGSTDDTLRATAP